MTVHLDQDDRLVDYRYTKVTCSKEIGGDAPYEAYCRGRTVDEIVAIPFQRAVEDLKVEEPDDRFLLYLQWDALRSALVQFKGGSDQIDRERYKIASISHDAGSVEIILVIRPPKRMPPILPCALRE